MNSFFQYINNHRVAENVIGRALNLLGAPPKINSVCLASSLKETISFAAAIKTNAPAPFLKDQLTKIHAAGPDTLLSVASHNMDIGQDKESEAIIERLQRVALSSAQRIHRAIIIARLGRVDQAKELIANVYRDDKNIQDAYATLGWRLYGEKKAFDQVIENCELDNEQHRLSTAWRLNLAYAYLATGDIARAKKNIAQAYESDYLLTDAYANVGWRHYWPKWSFSGVIEFCELDAKRNKLSYAWRLNLSQAYAANGQPETASDIISETYEKQPNSQDGFAYLGWNFYHQRGDYPTALDLALRDAKANRLSPQGRLNLATEFAFNDHFEEAENIIQDVYSSNHDVFDAHAQCGWLLFSPQNNFAQTIKWAEKDISLNRLSPNWASKYALALAATGQTRKAFSLVTPQNKLSVYLAIAGGMTHVGRFQESVELYEQAESLRPLERSEKLNHATSAILMDDYARVSRLTENYALSIGQLALNRFFWFVIGRANKPNYEKLIEFIQLDFKRQRVVPETYSALTILNALQGDLSESSRLALAGSQRFPEQADILKTEFAAYNLVYSLDNRIPAANALRTTNTAVTPIWLFNQATWFTVAEMPDRAERSLRRLLEIHPTFFSRKNEEAFISTMWCGLILEKFREPEAAARCLRFAEERAPTREFFSPLIESVRMTTPFPEKYSLPEISLPTP